MKARKLERLAVALLYAGTFVIPPGTVFARDDGADCLVGNRTDVALIINTPTGKIANSDASQIIRYADNVLKDVSDLKPVEVADQLGCKGNHTCYVQMVRPDYTEHLSTFKVDPGSNRLISFSEVRNRLKALNRNVPRYLVVLSAARSTDGTDRVSSILIDTDEALIYIHEENSKDPPRTPNVFTGPREDELEAKIVQYAARGTAPPITITGGDEQVETYVRDLFERDFRPELEKSGHWRPYGTIELVVEQPGLEIDIDGKKCTTKAGATLIGAVHPGVHKIVLSHPEFEEATAEATVTTGQTAMVKMTPIRKPREVARTVRQGVFWGGIVLAAAGAVVTTLALERAINQEYTVYCLSDATTPCPDTGAGEFVNTTSLDNVGPRQDPNRTGIPYAPLGYSMLAAGVGWSLGSLFIGEEDDWPVWGLGIGLATFLGLFFASGALDQKEFVESSTTMGLRASPAR